MKASDLFSSVLNLAVEWEFTTPNPSTEQLGAGTHTIQFLPQGKFQHPWYGELNFSADNLRQMQANYDNKAHGDIDLMIDEDHRHGQAVGWVKGLRYGAARNKGTGKVYHGLFGDIAWTPLGQDLITNKLYKYFSAEVITPLPDDQKHSDLTKPAKTETQGSVVIGGGLTNRPFFKMMAPVVQDQQSLYSDRTIHAEQTFYNVSQIFEDERWEFSDSEAIPVATLRFDPESKSKEVPVEEFLAQFSEFSVTSIDALKALVKSGLVAQQTLTAVRDRAKAVGIELSDDVAASIEAAYKALKTTNVGLNDNFTTLTTSFDDLKKKFDTREAEAAVDGLIRQGKVLPTERDGLVQLHVSNPPMFHTLTDNRPVLVELGERGSKGKSPEPGSDVQFNDPEKAGEEADRYAKLLTRMTTKP